jgi:hypothetical protein
VPTAKKVVVSSMNDVFRIRIGELYGKCWCTWCYWNGRSKIYTIARNHPDFDVTALAASSRSDR